jgi:hypothetical protein
MYIGITTDFIKRKREHLFRSGYIKRPFYQALNKYKGLEKWEIIYICDEKTAQILEQKLIDLFNTQYPNGYNLTTGGEHFNHNSLTKANLKIKNTGKIRTEEMKKRISESKRGTIPWNKGKKGIYNEEVIEKMSIARRGMPSARKGITLNEETKSKVSNGLKIYFSNPGNREKLSKACMGRVPWNKGLRMSAESRKKLSASCMGRIPWNKRKRHI